MDGRISRRRRSRPPSDARAGLAHHQAQADSGHGPRSSAHGRSSLVQHASLPISIAQANRARHLFNNALQRAFSTADGEFFPPARATKRAKEIGAWTPLSGKSETRGDSTVEDRPSPTGGWDRRAIREPNDRLRYGGPWFSAASDLPLERDRVHLGYAARSSPRRSGGSASRGVVRGASWTRSDDVFLSGSLAGEALRAYFNQRSLGVFPQNRLCRGCCSFRPITLSIYVAAGARRCGEPARAAAAGIVCEKISDPAAALDAAAGVFRSRRASFSDKERRTLETDGAFLFAGPRQRSWWRAPKRSTARSRFRP